MPLLRHLLFEFKSSQEDTTTCPKGKYHIASAIYHISVRKCITFPTGKISPGVAKILFATPFWVGCCLCFILRLTGQVHTQLLKSLFVHFRKNNGRMGLAATELAELLHCPFRYRVGCRTDGKGQQHLIRVESGISVS